MSREAHVRICERLGHLLPRSTRLLMSAPPNMAPSEIMRRVKGRSSSKLFEKFPELKRHSAIKFVMPNQRHNGLDKRQYWKIERML